MDDRIEARARVPRWVLPAGLGLGCGLAQHGAAAFCGAGCWAAAEAVSTSEKTI